MFKRYFTKEDRQVSNEDLRYSATLDIREIQIKTTSIYNYIPIRKTYFKMTIPSVGNDEEQLQHSYTGGGNSKCNHINLACHSEISF